MKPQVEIYLDEGEGRCDTNIEFYIDPNHTLSVSIDPAGNIDWAYLWGEHNDHGSGSVFKQEKQMKPSESELNFAAEEYVFDKNGHKFSNNNDEAGDNFASFLAGANWAIDTHTQTNEWKSAAMKLGEKLSPNGPDDYYGFTADQWLQWTEESVKKLNTTKEDIDDIKAIAFDIQQMAAKADYSDNTFAEFAYDVDQAMRAILEIIEKPKCDRFF